MINNVHIRISIHTVHTCTHIITCLFVFELVLLAHIQFETITFAISCLNRGITT